MEIITFILPEYWANYLINGEEITNSQGTDPDQELVESFLKEHNLPLAVSCSEEPYFSWSNDANTGMGGNVLEYTFLR